MMKRAFVLLGALFGGLTALVVVALNFLAFQLAELPRPAFSLFDWLTRALPGGLITFMIDAMVTTITRLNLGPTSAVAKRVEQGLAVALFFLIGVFFGLALGWIGSRRPRRLGWYGLVGGLILAVLMIAVRFSLPEATAGPLAGGLWLLLVFLGWGWVLGKLIQYTAQARRAEVCPTTNDRRQFLYLVGLGSATILVTAAGVTLLRPKQNESLPVTGSGNEGPTPPAGGGLPPVNAATTAGPAQSPPEAALADRIQPVPGTRPELTTNEKFYRIDINTFPPSVDGNSWRLQLEGLVDHPMQLTLDEIRARPAYSQAITLECISNRLGGDLISTARWTGIRLKDLLAEAGLKSNAKEVHIEAVDGFYESVPMDEAMDERTLLVYEMNGEPLPEEHGFPLRIYIPNHFGMKQPKWITRMEVIAYEGAGYWVERGWSDTAIPPTTSVIDVVALDQYDAQSGILPVGGIAYAGARGISKVEVQVDNGPWTAAELRAPALSPLTWVQWRYDWPSQPGQHTFQVRAYDGSGDLQPVEDSSPHPNGATGIYSVSERVPEQGTS